MSKNLTEILKSGKEVYNKVRSLLKEILKKEKDPKVLKLFPRGRIGRKVPPKKDQMINLLRKIEIEKVFIQLRKEKRLRIREKKLKEADILIAQLRKKEKRRLERERRKIKKQIKRIEKSKLSELIKKTGSSQGTIPLKPKKQVYQKKGLVSTSNEVNMSFWNWWKKISALATRNPNKKLVVYVYKEWALDSINLNNKLKQLVTTYMKNWLVRNPNANEILRGIIETTLKSRDFHIEGSIWRDFVRKMPKGLKRKLSAARKRKYERVGTNFTTTKNRYPIQLAATLAKIASSWQNYTDDKDDKYQLKLKVVMIPTNFVPKFELFTSPDYNCTLALIKSNLSKIRKCQIKILDDTDRYLKEHNIGCTIEILDAIMPKLSLCVTFIDMIGKKIKEYKSTQTTKKIYILAHNNHAILVPREFLKEDKKIKIEQVESIEQYKNENTIKIVDNKDYKALLDPITNTIYKTYISKFGYDNALSEISDYKKDYKNKIHIELNDNNIRRKAVQIPIQGSWYNHAECDICVDKCNSYRSAYYYMLEQGHSYPTLLEKYIVNEQNQKLANEIIEKYEGMAYIEITQEIPFPLDLLNKGNNYYVFPVLRQFQKHNIDFNIKFIAFSKIGETYVNNDLLEKENNLKFNMWNGSLLPNPKTKKIRKELKSKDEFLDILQYLVKNNYPIKKIEYGDLLESTTYAINRKDDDFIIEELNFDDFEEDDDQFNVDHYEVEYIEKDVVGFQRPLVYSYNLAYQQVQLTNFLIEQNIEKQQLISIRTDGIRLDHKVKLNEKNIINKQRKDELTPKQLTHKWQYEHNKVGFTEVFNPIESEGRGEQPLELNEVYKNLSQKTMIPTRSANMGMGGTGKTKLAMDMMQHLDNYVTLSATGLSASNFEDGKTIHSYLNYHPDKKTKKWQYSKRRPFSEHSTIFIDECPQAGKKHLEKLIEENPYSNQVCMGDLNQSLPIDDDSISESIYWNDFEIMYIPDEECRRYINTDGTINEEYRDLVIQLKNLVTKDTPNEHVQTQRNNTRKYMNQLRKESQLFNSLFNYNDKTEYDTYLCPMKYQASQRRKQIKQGSKIIHDGSNRKFKKGTMSTVIEVNGDHIVLQNDTKLKSGYLEASAMTIAGLQGIEFDLSKKICILDKIVSIRDLYIACSRVRHQKCVTII